MRKKAVFLLSACVLAGCSVNGQKAGEHPEVFTEDKKMHDAMRAEAEYQMTGKVTDKRLSYLDPNARIKLKPTPGKERVTGPGLEVLTSTDSGGYFAFIHQMPITQYFSIVRRADCDEWGTYVPLSVKRLQNNPGVVAGGKFRMDKPWFACFPAFEDHFANGDEKFKGSDGAVFDPSTIKIDETAIYWIPLTNKVKSHMDGWAIKFEEPSHEQIVAHLKSIPGASRTIKRKQFSTMVYWIEANKARRYVEPLLSLLPTRDPNRSPYYWDEIDSQILHTLAKIAPESIPFDFWIGIIEKGVRPGFSKTNPLTNSSAGNAPDIAANVIVCRKEDKKELIRRFTEVLTNSYPIEHKRAAAEALHTLGATTVVEKIRPSMVSTALLPYHKGVSGYTCPYSRPNDAAS